MTYEGGHASAAAVETGPLGGTGLPGIHPAVRTTHYSPGEIPQHVPTSSCPKRCSLQASRPLRQCKLLRLYGIIILGIRFGIVYKSC